MAIIRNLFETLRLACLKILGAKNVTYFVVYLDLRTGYLFGFGTWASSARKAILTVGLAEVNCLLVAALAVGTLTDDIEVRLAPFRASAQYFSAVVHDVACKSQHVR